MRKRNCDKIFDNIMWYTIYLLPIIITLVIIGTNFTGDWFTLWYDTYGWDLAMLPAINVFNTVMGNFDFIIFDDVYNVFYNVCELVGPIDSVVPYAIISYLSYFVSIYMLHLMVDFLLFIPRLAHKWMKDFTKGD